MSGHGFNSTEGCTFKQKSVSCYSLEQVLNLKSLQQSTNG